MVGRAYQRAASRVRGANWLPALLLAAAFVLASCSGDDNGGTDGDVTTPGEPTKVTLWHSMSSPFSVALERMVAEFNESQELYQVELIFQGSYTDSLTKLISSMGSGNIPAIIQLSDVSTQIMVDSWEITPIQGFIDAESYDLSDFDSKALSYYRVDGSLHAMPFNLAGPILYYDRLAFEEAGLDPDRPPRTLEEVREYSERLVQRDGQGEITRSGIALQISAWFFEQMLAKQGALYVNNGNGREGRATEAVFDGEEGKRIFQWWDDMVDEGLALNAGRGSTDAMLAIAQGRAVMAIASTAGLGAAVLLLPATGEDADRLGTGPLPAPEGEGGGIVLGGAAFWILRGRPEREQQGAWEFIKFASSAEQQAQWHAATGYFPNRLSAYDLPAAVERREQFPQFETAVQQLRASPDNLATQGALLGPFRQVRDRVTQAFEQVLAGGADPAQELEAAARDATRMIEDYNRTAP